MTIESNAMVAWFGIQHSQWKYDINKNEKALGHQKNTNLIKISSRPFYISFQYVSVFFAVGGRRYNCLDCTRLFMSADGYAKHLKVKRDPSYKLGFPSPEPSPHT